MFHLQKRNRLFCIWFVISCLVPLLSVSLHNYYNPTMPIYMSSLFYDKLAGNSLQIYALLAIIILQDYFLLLGFLTSLIGDLMPLFLALNYQESFDSVNNGLRKLKLVLHEEVCTKMGEGRLSPSTLALISEDLEKRDKSQE